MSAKKFFGERADDWLLQEDNDSKHWSRAPLESSKIDLRLVNMFLDVNPIKNVWAFMKRKLQEKRMYILKVMHIWRSLFFSYVIKLGKKPAQTSLHYNK